MTLRLTDDETEALRDCADRLGKSMQEVARLAIAEFVSNRQARLASAIRAVATEDAELLDRLSR